MIANWADFPEYVFIGSMGAACLEGFKNYELKNQKNTEQYKSIITSSIYWIKFFLFLFASGFVAWAMYENNPNTTVWQIFIAGMSANALANKSIEAALSKEQLHAGGESRKVSFRDLF